MQAQINALEDENLDLKAKLKHAVYAKEKNGYDNFLRGLEKVSSANQKNQADSAKHIHNNNDISLIERNRSNEAYDDYLKTNNNRNKENRPRLFSPDTTFDLNLSVRSNSRPPLDRVSPNVLNSVRAKYNEKLLKSMESKSYRHKWP